MSTTTYLFMKKNEKYQYFGLIFKAVLSFLFFTFIDHKSGMTQIDSYEFRSFITCL